VLGLTQRFAAIAQVAEEALRIARAEQAGCLGWTRPPEPRRAISSNGFIDLASASLTPDPDAFDADLEVVVNDPLYRHQNPHRFPLKVADGGKTLMVGPSLVNENNCTFVQMARQLPIALAKWRTLPLCTNLWIVDRSLPRLKNNSSLLYNGAPRIRFFRLQKIQSFENGS
jgi:hypothetical protein